MISVEDFMQRLIDAIKNADYELYEIDSAATALCDYLSENGNKSAAEKVYQVYLRAIDQISSDIVEVLDGMVTEDD